MRKKQTEFIGTADKDWNKVSKLTTNYKKREKTYEKDKYEESHVS